MEKKLAVYKLDFYFFFMGLKQRRDTFCFYLSRGRKGRRGGDEEERWRDKKKKK